MLSKPEEDRHIFNETVSEPWQKFFDVINSMKKNTKLVSIVKNPMYISFNEFYTEFMTSKS